MLVCPSQGSFERALWVVLVALLAAMLAAGIAQSLG